MLPWSPSIRGAVSAVALTGAAVLLAPAAAAASVPDDALAVASYGRAQVWLQREASDRTRRELVYQPSAGVAPRTLDVTVPRRDMTVSSQWGEQLALGRDRAGRLTVVVTSRRGLYRTRVAAARTLRRVPGTTRRDSYPSVFRGRLAYVHQRGTRSRVMTGSLTDGASRTAWTNAADTASAAAQTAIGANGAVAFVVVADGAEVGLFDAKLARPDGRVLDVYPGDRHAGELSLSVSSHGRRLRVSGPSTWRYALPSGRRLR